MERKVTSKFKTIKKRIRRRTLFLLILTFITNTFAWFIYSNKISNEITTGVKSWKITFEQEGGTTLENEVSFQIDTLYPGMTNYSDSIAINNSGEMQAYVTYEITSVRIMNDSYANPTYTSNQLISKLANDYPFSITFAVDNPTISVTQTANFTVSCVWPYESEGENADAIDTEWGKRAYTYKQTNPTNSQIQINVKITATQNNPG